MAGATQDPALAQLGASVAGEVLYAWRENLFLDSLSYAVAEHLVRRVAAGATRP